MKNSWVRIIIAILIFTTGFINGCANVSDDSSTDNTPVELPVLTNVTFKIDGLSQAESLRAAVNPTVVFQLELLNPTSTTSPILTIRKNAAVSAEGSGFSAMVTFENVPTLPCMAKMTITGGHIVSATDSKSYSSWVGLKDLVAGTGNVITLYGEGSKAADDVSYNLLHQLLVDPKAITTLATPIIGKANDVVAGLNLSSGTVYADAKTAYDQLYGSVAPPADAEFNLPTGYTSVAYPKKDASTNLAISNFTSLSEVYLVLENRTGATLAPSWATSRAASGNMKASITSPMAADKAENSDNSVSGSSISEEHKFHLMLRQLPAKLPPAQVGFASIRPGIRAVSVNDTQTFKAYLTGSVVTSLTATCKRVADIAGTTKKVYFFLDNADLGRSGLETVLESLVAAWENIYATNRRVFGAEPENTLNGVDVNDLYILLSSRIFTAGYFYSGDMYPVGTPGLPYSNGRKMFYLQYPTSSFDLNGSISSLSSTMAHEFQHMIHYYQKRNLTDPSSWLDEAMSGYAEQVNGFKIENEKNQSKALQVQKYLSYVNRISVNEWYTDDDADDDADDIGHAHYGKAYLFGTWLAQNYGTSGSVQNLLSVQQIEEAAVAAFTGEPFNETVAKFHMALLVNDSSAGIYGIQGLDLTNTYSFGIGQLNVTLSGPTMTSVNFSGATTGNPSVYPYAASYVKITNGTGTALNVSATLPAGVSLFQLKK